MLDPASAIGLAASLVQLSIFTKDVITKSHEVYQSARGVTVELADIDNVTTKMKSLMSSIRKQGIPTLPQEVESDEVEHELQELSECLLHALKPLINTLDNLKMRKTRKYESMRVALLTVLKEDVLVRLENRVDRYRKQIDTTLLVSLRQWIARVQETQSEKFDSIQDSLSILMKDSKLHEDVLTRLKKSTTFNEAFIHDDISLMSSEILTSTVDQNQEDTANLHIERLVEALKFKEMPSRQEAIPGAYQQTFEWVFTKSAKSGQSDNLSSSDLDTATQHLSNPNTSAVWDDFPEMVRGDSKLYWVTGKPGAGKSTLMKFLYNDPRTEQNAKQWAARTCGQGVDHSAKQPELRMAAFFCWNSGDEIQMSQTGLRRTLLYQLLKDEIKAKDKVAIDAYYELVQTMFRDRFLRRQLFGRDPREFDLVELTKALDILLSRADRQYLLFVDGLDEFDGTILESADFALRYSNMANVKMCVSSRPWTVFEDAFDDRPMLRVEDLTRDDIRNYITGKFNGSKQFRKLRGYKSESAETLIENVANKASGVFLWVYVVVESLLEGLRDGDDMDDLQRRLNDLPIELEDLFRRILHRLNPSYKKDASELFQLVRSVPDEATLLGVYYCHKAFTEAMTTTCDHPSKEGVQFYTETMRRRLYSRCKCLLEVESANSPWIKIKYLHRSVREYLEQERVWTGIKKHSLDYDPPGALAVSFLLLAKTVDFAEKDSKSARILLTKAIVHMGTSKNSESEKIEFLAEVERTGYCIAKSNTSTSDREGAQQHHWSWQLFDPERETSMDAMPTWWVGSGTSSLFDLAFAANLVWYVKPCLERDPSLSTASVSNQYPLTIAVKHKYWDMQFLLLDYGADPNYEQDRRTPWSLILHSADVHMGKCDAQTRMLYTRTITKFLQCGADPHTSALVLPVDQIITRLIASTKRDFGSKEEVEELTTTFRIAQEKAHKVQTLTATFSWSTRVANAKDVSRSTAPIHSIPRSTPPVHTVPISQANLNYGIPDVSPRAIRKRDRLSRLFGLRE